MKKQLLILGALSVFSTSNAFAAGAEVSWISTPKDNKTAHPVMNWKADNGNSGNWQRHAGKPFNIKSLPATITFSYKGDSARNPTYCEKQYTFTDEVTYHLSVKGDTEKDCTIEITKN